MKIAIFALCLAGVFAGVRFGAQAPAPIPQAAPKLDVPRESAPAVTPRSANGLSVIFSGRTDAVASSGQGGYGGYGGCAVVGAAGGGQVVSMRGQLFCIAGYGPITDHIEGRFVAGGTCVYNGQIINVLTAASWPP